MVVQLLLAAQMVIKMCKVIGSILTYDLKNSSEQRKILYGHKEEVNHLDFSARKIIRNRK